MIIIKTEDEIKKMQVAGKVLSDVHHKLRDFIKPGVKTIEIDRFVENYLKERGAYPEQKGYEGYPYSVCASVNDEICHGFPTEYELKDGDIITVDMVVNVDGWLADSAWSYEVGNVSPEAKKLLQVTREAMYKGIEKAVIGNRLGDIGSSKTRRRQWLLCGKRICWTWNRSRNARRPTSSTLWKAWSWSKNPRGNGIYY